MIGGGIAGIIALQAAGAFDSYKKEEPSYTTRQSYTPCKSQTSSPYCCATSQPNGFSTGSL